MRRADISRRAALGLFAGGAGLSLGGCSSLLIEAAAGDPPRLYRLTSKSTFPDDAPKVGWQLVVEPPSAAASINTNRIGLMEGPYRFNYFADASWIDRAPLMVQNLIIESFDNSDAIVGVGPDAIGLRPNFVLQPELREFQAQRDGDQQKVVVAINARLVQMPDRKIVAVEQFSSMAMAPAGALDPVIDAFDQALGKVLKRLVIWTLTEGEKARKAQLRSRGSFSSGTGSPGPSVSDPSQPLPPRRPIRRLERPTTAG